MYGMWGQSCTRSKILRYLWNSCQSEGILYNVWSRTSTGGKVLQPMWNTAGIDIEKDESER